MNVRLVEALLGGGAGAFTGYKATRPDQFTGQVDQRRAKRNALIGGVFGLGLGSVAGKPLRAVGVKSYNRSAGNVIRKERAVVTQARQALHKMRLDRAEGKNIGYYDDVFERKVAPNVNTIINSRHARPVIEDAIKTNRKITNSLPFGIGSLVGKVRLTFKTHRFTVPYEYSGLRMKEDIKALSRKERKYLMDKLFSGAATDKQTDRLLSHLTKRYYQK